MIDLSGKTVLITGSSKGIGKQMCYRFATLGATIISHIRKTTDEHIEFINNLPSNTQNEHVIFESELSDLDEFKKNLIHITKQYEIYGLVNNAGITHNAILAMTTMVDLQEQLTINTIVPFISSQIVSKKMIRRKQGSILNVVSTAAFDGNKGKIAYGSSKSATFAMTQSMSRELGPYNVRVNAIAPGITNTSMLNSMSQEIIDEAVENSDLKKSATPDDIANVAAFLISENSSYLTGEVIRVDGGMF